MKYLILLCCALPLYATVIVQKNGDVISGTIAEEKNDRYIFQSPYGKLQIKKSNISKLILDEKTIELTTIKHNDQTVQARLVSDENNKQIYLTEDGQTIRKEAETKTAEPVEVGQKFIVGLTGGYGWSTFPQIDTAPPAAGSGMPPLEQSFHLGTLNLQVAGHYLPLNFLGFGLATSYYRWQGEATLNAQPGQISYDSKILNQAIFLAPSAVFSLFGNLGSANRHDLRLEIAPGISLNYAAMDLALRNGAGNFPTSATSTGKQAAFAVEAKLNYLISITANLRLKLGVGYFRIFQTGIYDTGLQGNIPFPPGDGFKRDFDSILAQSAKNPQALTATFGVEYGF